MAGRYASLSRSVFSAARASPLRSQAAVPWRPPSISAPRCHVPFSPPSMQKYMDCRGACLASIGPDQPAEVIADAPKHLYPGACLYTNTQNMLSCDGSHQHTRRLCPCA